MRPLGRLISSTSAACRRNDRLLLRGRLLGTSFRDRKAFRAGLSLASGGSCVQGVIAPAVFAQSHSEGGSADNAAELHRLDGRARHDYDRGVLLETLVEHVH